MANPDLTSGTGLILFPQAGALPAVWAGPVPDGGLEPGDAAALLQAVRPCGLLPEHGEGWFGRPGLSGHRLAPGGHPAAGRDWSPLFRPLRSGHGERRTLIEAEDTIAGLRLETEAEAVPGGAIRVRHTVTNTGRQPYVVDSLEVVFPLPGRVGEVLDFTGRQTAERIPQRHRLGDGLWLRESRRGHTGHDSATVVVAGVPGFGIGCGEVFGVHVAWSGNTVHRVERVPSGLGMVHSRPPRQPPPTWPPNTSTPPEALTPPRHQPNEPDPKPGQTGRVWTFPSRQRPSRTRPMGLLSLAAVPHPDRSNLGRADPPDSVTGPIGSLRSMSAWMSMVRL